MSLKEDIQDKLAQLGSSPKRSLGQNFLIDENIVKRIVEAVKGCQPNSLVEVGPGLGSLTERLRGLDVPLLLIELDREFAGLWRGEGLELLEEDALMVDWNSLNLAQGTTLVSNLPYQISSSIVIDRCLGPLAIESMVLMFQKEVAQRIMAGPKTKEYGLLSVVAQLFWRVRAVCEAGPRCFWPAPQVASRVLLFNRLEDAPNCSGQALLRFVKAAFSHRRKILWKNLSGEYSRFGVEMDLALRVGQDLGLGHQVRAEELSPRQFRLLFEELSRAGKENQQ
ncbi:MAG: ribosomal RNA small subunit methyltransferase A [Bdellovibrionaceae bacterium]|nr:ribosomal RNA small subunit methyltransferase A [Bdellovibrionales bacterium]MCB9084821.1 ribosomal RNA small subunit methyltransferase A [Pseudobdellovibrionaceae bacterium]